MLGIEVTLSGQPGQTAALPDTGVLTAILSIVRRRDTPETTEIRFDLSGLLVDDTCRWIDQRPAVGATMTLRLVEIEAGDPPVTREPRDPDFRHRMELKTYRYLRRRHLQRKRRKRQPPA